MSARWWAHLALIDVLILTGIAAGAVWLACTHLTAMHPPAVLLLAVLAAVATFSMLAGTRRP
ncbi:hypothetical protein [Actinomadura rudentiformis]|uniref:Uncharacterized protein n=1 Tax=Actinomadura rudentiformis TaxID=359158 RepID=A0A6H9YL68_9ACTN|nr:hypothetical protein [Actinomadura rudentiformis]KAB2347249.1 hypothetical protein F8566_19695 [Actinomadura rudentiformis]